MRVPIIDRFADSDNGDIRRLETPRGKFIGDVVPSLAQLGTYVVKLAMLAPLVIGGGWTVAAVGLAGLIGASKLWRKVAYSELDTPGSTTFNLNENSSRSRFLQKFGQTGADILQDIDVICKSIGSTEYPHLSICSDPSQKACYTAHAVTVNEDGSKSIVSIGQKTMETLTRGELRTVIAHEMAHVKLRHSNMMVNALGRKFISGCATLALVGAAVFGPLAVVPTVITLAGLSFADRLLDTAKSRYHEKVADRAANMVTGDGEKMADAITKMRQLMRENKHQIDDSPGLIGAYGKLREMFFKAVSRPLWRLMYEPHQKDDTRRATSRAFTSRYEAFCEKRRGRFTDTFNRAARKDTAGFSGNRLRSEMQHNSGGTRPGAYI